MTTHNRILITVGFLPYPCYFGGAFDVYGRMVALKKLGYSIDLVCTCKTQPSEADIETVKQVVDTIYITGRKNRVIDLLRIEPLQAASRRSLKTVPLDKAYDLVVLESESTAPILENKTLEASKIALRVHNNESKYFFQLGGSTANIFKKLYYYLDAIKFKIYSKKIFSKVHRLWFISIDEMQESYRNADFAAKAFHLPSSSGQVPVQQKLKGRNVLFVGSLFMVNNINAIDWYLENVHGQVVKNFPDYTFIIAGSTGDVKPEALDKKYKGYKNLKIQYNVPDLSALYADAAVFVNPMQYGTGVKLKSLNAIMNGLPLVSTHTGSEGIGLADKEMFFKADSPEDFYAAIERLFTSDRADVDKMVKKAQEFITADDYTTILKKETDDLFR